MSASEDPLHPCERCGKAVPAQNRALHTVRCRAVEPSSSLHHSHTQHTQQLTVQSYNSNKEAIESAVPQPHSFTQPQQRQPMSNDSTQQCSTSNQQSIEPTAPPHSLTQQWECRYCTYLNDYSIPLTDTVAETCSICGYAQNELVCTDDTWRDTSSDCSDCSTCSDEHTEESPPTDEFETLETWTCTYCTVVNTSCEMSCHMCDMPHSGSGGTQDSSRRESNNIQTVTPNVLQRVEAALPAICYLGLTAVALLADTSQGSSRRNGLMGSLVGSMAGVAVAAYMTSGQTDETQVQENSIISGRDNAAERLPVHRFQSHSVGCSGDSSSCSAGSGEPKSHVHEQRKEDDDKVSCRICMEEYEHNVEIKTMKCFHMFHANCIDQWLLRKTSCPLCCTDI